MPKVVLRHKVGNFDTWLKGHQDRVDIFSKFGPGFETYRDVDDMEGLQATMGNPDIMQKIAKEKHTVLDPITVSMPVAV